MKKNIKKFLIIIIPIFLILHFLGWWKFYYQIPGYDKIIHFFAGASVVLFFFHVFQEYFLNWKIKKIYFFSLICLLLITISWEIFEYIVDNFIKRPFLSPLQLGWFDTLTDFLANFAGAGLVLVIIYFKQGKKDKLKSNLKK